MNTYSLVEIKSPTKKTLIKDYLCFDDVVSAIQSDGSNTLAYITAHIDFYYSLFQKYSLSDIKSNNVQIISIMTVLSSCR